MQIILAIMRAISLYIYFFLSLFNRALLDMNEFSLNDNMERFIIKNKNYNA